MRTPLISVIIPVYRAENFLSKCLDSLINQTFIDWECILVDDGSPDKSGEICEEYALRDARFRVFHKENGGVSSARNLGLDNICGEFVTFIDSDDYVGPTYLNLFAEHSNFDLIFTGLHRVGSVDQIWFGEEEIAFPSMKELASAWMDNFEKKHLTLGGLNFVACKALRSKYIIDNKLRFDPQMKKGEDTCFVYEWMMFGKNAIQVKGNEYYYYTPEGGHDFKMTLMQYQSHCFVYQKHIESIRDKYGVYSQRQLDSYVNSTFGTYYQTYFNARLNYVLIESRKFRAQNRYPVFDSIRREKGKLAAWSVKQSFQFPLFFYTVLRFRTLYLLFRKALRIILKRK